MTPRHNKKPHHIRMYVQLGLTEARSRCTRNRKTLTEYQETNPRIPKSETRPTQPSKQHRTDSQNSESLSSSAQSANRVAIDRAVVGASHIRMVVRRYLRFLRVLRGVLRFDWHVCINARIEVRGRTWGIMMTLVRIVGGAGATMGW